MKKLLIILCLLLCVGNAFAKGIRTCENPPVLLSNTRSSLTFSKVILTDTATVIECHSTYRPKFWIRISKSSFLTVDGNKYALKKGLGITPGEHFWIPESGEADFKLVFEPLPQNTKEFTFKEGEGTGDWAIIGVNITGKKNEVKLPKELTEKKSSAYSFPEIEMNPGIATINGHILGIPQGNKVPGTISYTDAAGRTTSDFVTDEFGNFSFSGGLIHPTSVNITVYNHSVDAMIVPNKSIDVYFNLPVLSQPKSKSKQKGFYFNGAMEEFNEEIASMKFYDKFAKMYDWDNDLQKSNNITPEEYLDKLKSNNKIILQQINNSELSDVAKDYLRANFALESITPVIAMSSIMAEAKVRRGELSQDSMRSYMEDINKKVSIEDRVKLLSEYFSNIKNNNIFPVALNYDYKIGLLNAFVNRGLVWGGADVNFTKDYILLSNLYKKVKSYTPLTDDELAQVKNDVVRKKLSADNDALKAKIEENKKKTTYRVNEVGDVVNEDLFASITNKYRCKVILVDFWATWCGPCKMAHKTMKPMKEELKDKMVFLYIAGENSPKQTWENMIADIDGEHVRLNDSQWDYLCKEFKANGVPTYLLLDKEGNLVYKSVGYPGNEEMKSQIDKVLNK